MNIFYFFILLFVLNKPTDGMKRNYYDFLSTGNGKAPAIPLENKVSSAEKFSFIEITIIAEIMISVEMAKFKDIGVKTNLNTFINAHKDSLYEKNRSARIYSKIFDKLKKVVDFYCLILNSKLEEKGIIFNKFKKSTFIFWHLFIFTRMLIKNFILYHNNIAYNKILALYGQKISIFRYIDSFNKLEEKASNFMYQIKQLEISYYGNVENKQKFVNDIIMSAEEAEKIMYPVELDIFYFSIDEVNTFLPMSYLTTNVINNEFTNEECSYIMKNINKNLKELFNKGNEQIKEKISNLLFEKNRRELFLINNKYQAIHNNFKNQLIQKCKYVTNLYGGQSSGQEGQAFGYNEEQEERNKFYTFL